MATWITLANGTRFDRDQIFAFIVKNKGSSDGTTYGVDAVTSSSAVVSLASDLATQDDAVAVIDNLLAPPVATP